MVSCESNQLGAFIVALHDINLQLVYILTYTVRMIFMDGKLNLLTSFFQSKH